MALGSVTFDQNIAPLWLSPEQTKAICSAGARFPKLQQFSIRSESFGLDQIAAWPHFGQLNSLTIECPRLTDADLRRIGRLDRLQSLSLTSPAITDAGVKELAKLANVRALTLESPQITDVGLLSLPWLDQLTFLHLARTQVGDDCLDEIAAAHGLAHLILDGSQVTDAGLAKLEDTSIESLRLGQTQVSDQGMASLGRMKKLFILSLSDTKVTGEQMHHFLGPHRINILDLGGSPLTRAGFEQIAKLHVMDLNLHGTPLGDEELLLFLESPDLDAIDIRQTNVSLSGVLRFMAADEARLQKKRDQSPDEYVPGVTVKSDFSYDQLHPQVQGTGQ